MCPFIRSITVIATTVLAVIWFTTFGGTALDIEMSGAYPLADVATSEVELTLFLHHPLRD